MLSKFRYRFHHTSDALSHSLSGFRRGAAIVPENLAVIHLDPMDWDGLRALVETLSHSAEGLERLALTAGRLSRCIALFDNRARSRMEYGKIRVDINDLLHMLSNYVEGIMPHVKLQNKIEDLARAIGKEIELLTELGEGWVGLDEKAIKSRIDQVLEQYRAIKRLLGRFVLNETPTIWKATPEEAPPPDTRLDHLPHSPSAWYRPLSGDSIHRSGCEPNTRIEIVDEIRYWIRYNRDQGLYWLNGMAGTGKTTIAYSMCEHLESSGHPMASFFCAWQLPECRNVRLIIPSLSHQLSLLLGPFRSTIVMSEDVEVLNWSISEQFERLVATPLRRAGHTFLANPVIVIDGLEECDNHDEVDEIVRVLITNVPGLPIKVLVTGRPTLKMDFFVRELRSSCDLAELRLHELHWWNVQRDIKTYLQSQLESISPSVKDLEGLASQTGGLFKHATFYTHYLLSTDIPAKGVERMKRLLGDSLTRDRGGQTDFLYATILEAALDENASEGTKSADTMLVLHTVVCVSKALTASMLVGLLGLSPATSIKTLLETLGLVLQIVGSSGRVTVRHKSFLDYICDRNRSGKFYCNIEQHATLLAQKCFDPMKAPTPMCNISNLASSYLSDQDTPGVRERINDAIPDKLLHACRNWGTYIVSIGSSKKLQLDMVQEFLSTRLLLWMEILNLKRCMRDGAEQLQKIYIWLKVCNNGDVYHGRNVHKGVGD
ncbi:hypothetical protein FRC09_017283 [Ceratobasidium sp. 395]|nr:hypothetical protein FRC09_017283 [Ceratobasidium sp. 395]